jgi:hypothetical protein
MIHSPRTVWNKYEKHTIGRRIVFLTYFLAFEVFRAREERGAFYELCFNRRNLSHLYSIVHPPPPHQKKINLPWHDHSGKWVPPPLQGITFCFNMIFPRLGFRASGQFGEGFRGGKTLILAEGIKTFLLRSGVLYFALYKCSYKESILVIYSACEQVFCLYAVMNMRK